MIKVFVLFLFVRAAAPIVGLGATLEVGSYSSMKDCQSAADSATMKADDDSPEWKPFIGQWVCIERGASLNTTR